MLITGMMPAKTAATMMPMTELRMVAGSMARRLDDLAEKEPAEHNAKDGVEERLAQVGDVNSKPVHADGTQNTDLAFLIDDADVDDDEHDDGRHHEADGADQGRDDIETGDDTADTAAVGLPGAHLAGDAQRPQAGGQLTFLDQGGALDEDLGGPVSVLWAQCPAELLVGNEGLAVSLTITGLEDTFDGVLPLAAVEIGEPDRFADADAPQGEKGRARGLGAAGNFHAEHNLVTILGV
jgi:hypothetical protein